MASPTPPERKFERLNQAMHERLPFSADKISYGRMLSTGFEEPSTQLRVLAALDANGKESPPNDMWEELGCDKDGGRVCIDLALSGVPIQNFSGWHWIIRSVRSLSIPDSVEEIPGDCFSCCHGLSRVTFGQASSLKVIRWGHSVELP